MKKKISETELQKILESHKNWLNNEGLDIGSKGQCADLSNTDLRDACLAKVNLQYAILRGADLRNASLEDANLQEAFLENADLRGANLKNANLREANLNHAHMKDADISNANLLDANLNNAILSETNLQNANLKDTFMHNTCLRNANLNNANLEYANMSLASLIGAEIKNAKFRGANLYGVNLPNGMFQITFHSAANRYITYDSINDNIICYTADKNYNGCLRLFKEYVKATYGEGGKTPNTVLYEEYMAAIKFFKKIRKAERSINIQEQQSCTKKLSEIYLKT